MELYRFIKDIKYNEICKKCEMEDGTKSTFWEIPINDNFHEVFNDEKTVRNICSRFFNSKICNNNLKFIFAAKEYKDTEPFNQEIAFYKKYLKILLNN